jgi:hypothetical protein
MTKDDMVQVLKSVGVNENTVVAMCNAFDMGVEYEREECVKICKKHADVYAAFEQNPTAQSAWAACVDNHDAIKTRGEE